MLIFRLFNIKYYENFYLVYYTINSYFYEVKLYLFNLILKPLELNNLINNI